MSDKLVWWEPDLSFGRLGKILRSSSSYHRSRKSHGGEVKGVPALLVRKGKKKDARSFNLAKTSARGKSGLCMGLEGSQVKAVLLLRSQVNCCYLFGFFS